jgi:hypothetical protein
MLHILILSDSVSWMSLLGQLRMLSLINLLFSNILVTMPNVF